MPCSKCGKRGHNRRTCNQEEQALVPYVPRLIGSPSVIPSPFANQQPVLDALFSSSPSYVVNSTPSSVNGRYVFAPQYLATQYPDYHDPTNQLVPSFSQLALSTSTPLPINELHRGTHQDLILTWIVSNSSIEIGNIGGYLGNRAKKVENARVDFTPPPPMLIEFISTSSDMPTVRLFQQDCTDNYAAIVYSRACALLERHRQTPGALPPIAIPTINRADRGNFYLAEAAHANNRLLVFVVVEADQVAAYKGWLRHSNHHILVILPTEYKERGKSFFPPFHSF